MSTLTGLDFYRKYGHPGKKEFINSLVVFDVPTDLEIGFIPKKICCHPDLAKPLTQAFKNLIERGCVNELKAWDGCWNFRPIRGYEKQYQSLMNFKKERDAIKYLSIHSWALAIDVNASENGIGKEPKLSAAFVKCFTDAGFEWGGNWRRKDGMHFQLAKLPD